MCGLVPQVVPISLLAVCCILMFYVGVPVCGGISQFTPRYLTESVPSTGKLAIASSDIFLLNAAFSFRYSIWFRFKAEF